MATGFNIDLPPIDIDVAGQTGPANAVANMIESVWAAAALLAKAIGNITGPAVDAAQGLANLNLPTVDGTLNYDAPDRPDMPKLKDDPLALYDSRGKPIIDDLVNRMRMYIDTYFPGTTDYGQALAWCSRAITQGGTGVNAAVERQLWEREQARSQSEYLRQRASLELEWAARGYPLPPGALTGQVNALRVDAARQLAAASRDKAIEAWKMELENVRFAVQQVLDLRVKALQAAGQYLAALGSAYDTALRLPGNIYQAQAAYASALSAMYGADISAQETLLKSKISVEDLKLRGAETRAKLSVESVDARVRAALGAAQPLGSMAAAALNTINAGATISASTDD